MHTKAKGNQAEHIVAAYLKKHGYIILERNYRKTFGEIDIIARSSNCIAFIEVKARNHSDYFLDECISVFQQKKILRVAQSYLATLPDTNNLIYRFDAALINQQENNQITYIEDAFHPQELL